MVERDAAEVRLVLAEGYRFVVDMGADHGTLTMDEPPPLGQGAGPNASRMLGAAVGHCLAASLLYCMRRAHLDVEHMDAEVMVTPERDERGRLRIGSVDVRLSPVVAAGAEGRMGRCLELFEDFCVVTQSVRRGIHVEVSVEAPVEGRAGDTGGGRQDAPQH